MAEKKTGSRKPRTTRKTKKDVAEKISEHFELEQQEEDAINIDELVEDVAEKEQKEPEAVKKVLNKNLTPAELKEIQADEFIEQYATDQTRDLLLYMKHVYVTRSRFKDSFYHFTLKFRYFMISENIKSQRMISHKKLGKFIRFYPNMKIDKICRFFHVDP